MKRLFVWLNQIIKKHKEIKRWKRIVTVLAAMITFVTTYALILPAITVERNSTEEVGGMYLKQEEDRNELLEENAPELNGVSIAADQENAVTYEYSDEDMTAVPTFGTDEEAMAAAAETDAEIPDYSDSQEKSAPADSAETDGEEAAPEVGTLKAVSSDYTVTLTYDTTSEIPDGASLTVSEIAQDTKEYKTYLEETKRAMGLTEEETLPRFAARFFDIKIMVGDEEFTPKTGVSVEITYAEPLAENPETEVSAVHFADETAEAEVIDANASEVKDDGAATVEFMAESFSVYGVIYTVDFHWEVNGKTYEFSIPGGGFVSFTVLKILRIPTLIPRKTAMKKRSHRSMTTRKNLLQILNR